MLQLDEILIAEEEQHDGYYAIVTSEYALRDEKTSQKSINNGILNRL